MTESNAIGGILSKLLEKCRVWDSLRHFCRVMLTQILLLQSNTVGSGGSFKVALKITLQINVIGYCVHCVFTTAPEW